MINMILSNEIPTHIHARSKTHTHARPHTPHHWTHSKLFQRSTSFCSADLSKFFILITFAHTPPNQAAAFMVLPQIHLNSFNFVSTALNCVCHVRLAVLWMWTWSCVCLLFVTELAERQAQFRTEFVKVGGAAQTWGLKRSCDTKSTLENLKLNHL